VSVQELEAAVSRLSSEEPVAFRKWFIEFDAEAWDRQFEADVAAGKLDRVAERADQDFESGRCVAF
jgi:hypothetical protein